MTAARIPDTNLNDQASDSIVFALWNEQSFLPAASAKSTRKAAVINAMTAPAEEDSGYSDNVSEKEASAVAVGAVCSANSISKTPFQQAVDQYISALYKAEEPLLGARYLDFTHEDKSRKIALDKQLFANGLSNYNTREYMMQEFLLVLASQYQENPFSDLLTDQQGRACYVKRRQLLLRRILFNNPFLQNIEQATNNNGDKWKEWVWRFSAHNRYAPMTRQAVPSISDYDDTDADVDAVTEVTTKNGKPIKTTVADVSRIQSYNLEELFALSTKLGQADFKNFAHAIYLLRSWSLNFDDDKQWVYKFLFPFGRETLFSEISSTTTANVDYLKQSSNYMSGCGEMLFSMLQHACAYNAATDEDEIGRKLCAKFFPKNNPINDFARALTGTRSNQERAMQDVLITCNKSMEERLMAARSVEINESDHIDFIHKVQVAKTRMLAVKDHEVFQHLADDFNRILSLNLSIQDQFNTLSTIGMLHLMVFLLKIGRGACALEHMQNNSEVGHMINIIPYDEDHKNNVPWRTIDMVVAVKATTRSRLRQVSAQCLNRNNGLMRESLIPYAKAQARALMSLINYRALNGELSPKYLLFCADILKELFCCRPDINLLCKDPKAKVDIFNVETECEVKTFEEVLNNLCELILENDPKSLDVHLPYARSIGLVPATGSTVGNTSTSALTRTFYTLNDELVRNLVYATLGMRKHMLFEEFLAQLYNKYLLVIGPQQAAKNFKHERNNPNFIEEKEFNDNADDFKEQLRRLDLLLSLSDGFDYVCNPYGQR